MYKNRQPADTAAQTYNRNLYIAGLIIGILLFLPCLYIAHLHRITGLQGRIFYDFNNLSGSFTKPALLLTEALGSAYPIILCVLIPLLFRYYRLAWRFFVAGAATGVVMEIGKLIAKEPRPAALLQGHLHVRATETGLTSFPSGHASISTALALTLWLVLPGKWRWLSIVWIVVVGISRMYLGVHTATDIIGGFAIGLIVISVLQLLPAILPASWIKFFRLENDRLLEKNSF